ncbi:hypothetical protein ED28_07055 [[Pantoea] beijingensis]|uniref:Uncharacterized protein n=1 Tax=[Pantoea] beijingensis TaxID=1324864 RepID=A0A443IEY5_9GAMM|nr:CesT family type III secretion system chaperone [[Pantoea] beijingensis]RWR02616.1 hypothetical protein ED28_07055 [[Pantoea] beijingensis]
MASFNKSLIPLFQYIKISPEQRDSDEAFELALRSGYFLHIMDYPKGSVTFSCILPLQVEDEKLSATLWEILQLNLMNEQHPAITLAASATSREIVIWSRLYREEVQPQSLISLYERVVHYIEIVGKHLSSR